MEKRSLHPSIDFAKKPDRVIDYNERDLVTRENFIGMVIRSLGFDGGSIDRQELYFMWLDKNGRFENHQSQLTNLFNSGGWNILSDDERGKFVRVFENVTKHHYENLVSKPVEEFKLDPAGAFEANIPYEKFHTNLSLKIDLSMVNLVGMSKKDLLSLAKQYNI